MDNLKEADFLLSKVGQKCLVDLHVEGIVNYLNDCEY